MIGADIYDDGVLAGRLIYDGIEYLFSYDLEFLYSKETTAISLTLPKQKEPFVSKDLHPFFASLLAEGNLKELQCRLLKIDEDDEFTRLLKTATVDTIGTITLKERL